MTCCYNKLGGFNICSNILTVKYVALPSIHPLLKSTDYLSFFSIFALLSCFARPFLYISDLLQPDGCKLSVILAFHINSTLIWRLGNLASREASIVYMASEYNLYLLEDVSFHLVPHLLRLVALVAKVLCVKEK